MVSSIALACKVLLLGGLGVLRLCRAVTFSASALDGEAGLPVYSIQRTRASPQHLIDRYRRSSEEESDDVHEVLRGSPRSDDFVVHRARLENDGDSCYTSNITVGGQEMRFVPDTGSFSIVIFSDKCKRCGRKTGLYHSDASHTHRDAGLRAEQTYGSGETTSLAAYDTFTVGPLRSEEQIFWEVIRADMPIIEANNFQGIFGLGPPNSETGMAEKELTDMRDYYDRLQEVGDSLAGSAKTLQHLSDIASFTKKQTQWLKTVNMKRFSFCLKPASGSPGVLVYNDDAAHKYPDLFTRVPVVGDTYWSVALGKVQLGGELSAPPSQVDCWQRSCTGILDTGTSLIAAPPEAIEAVQRLVGDWNNNGGDCTDLSKLPELEFTLGGQAFSLPPQAYVGELSGNIPAWLREAIPHIDRFQAPEDKRKITNPTYCTPLLMNMYQKENEPTSWILGLPFFRKYYTSFELSPDSLTAASIAIARSDDECQVGLSSLYRTPAQRERRAFRLNAEKLRPPRWSRWSTETSSRWSDLETVSLMKRV